MTDSREYFEQSQLWGQEAEPYQQRVREDLLDLIPPDVRSVLDVGCGDGFVISGLDEKIEAVGVDLSAEALKHVRRPTKQASITELPFADGSFDLVMANDVLEHLGDADFAKATAELRRVSRRYVLVTVPFMENLVAGMTRCGACGVTYHVNHHVRNFGVQEMAGLLGGAAPAAVVFSGAAVDAAEVISREMRVKMGVAAQWDLAKCPHCGANASLGGSPAMRDAGDRAAVELARLRGNTHYDRSEIIALFDQKKCGMRNAECGISEQDALSDANPVHSDDSGKSPGNALPGLNTDNPAVPTARPSLVLLSKGRTAPVSATVTVRDQQLCLQPAEPSARENPSIRLALSVGQCVYLYGHPSRLGDALVVPPWFGADRLAGISAAEQVISPADADELLLVTLQGALVRADKLEVDLQNARAFVSALERQIGGREQLEISLQNIRAENDALKVRIGQLEQQLADSKSILGRLTR